MLRHVMVDLETLGSTPGCAIISIGAVEFFPGTALTFGKKFYANVDLQSCLDRGLKAEGDTFYWWMQQSEKARLSLLEARVPIFMALGYFADFLDTDAILWSHGSSFDLAVLSVAFHKIGMPKPWQFRNERDTRTVLDLAKMKMPKIEEAHNALADAENQAHTICKALEKIKGHEFS